jgi:hypothetical protein
MLGGGHRGVAGTLPITSAGAAHSGSSERRRRGWRADADADRKRASPEIAPGGDPERASCRRPTVLHARAGLLYLRQRHYLTWMHLPARAVSSVARQRFSSMFYHHAFALAGCWRGAVGDRLVVGIRARACCCSVRASAGRPVPLPDGGPRRSCWCTGRWPAGLFRGTTRTPGRRCTR